MRKSYEKEDLLTREERLAPTDKVMHERGGCLSGIYKIEKKKTSPKYKS